jgi:hypothetical protein
VLGELSKRYFLSPRERRTSTMAYEGDVLESCPPGMFDFTKAFAVIVTGTPPNEAGHMLLNTGGIGGMYFHVVGLNGRPRYMNEAGYRRYMKEDGKRERLRIACSIPHPEASQRKLEEIAKEKWLWLGLVNNCETMVEEIIVAGGGERLNYGPFQQPRYAGRKPTRKVSNMLEW